MLYLTCSFLSFLLILRITKYHALNFLSGTGEIDKFVALACYVVQAASKVYFIWLYTAVHSEKLMSIIERLSEMQYTKETLDKINRVR